MKRLLTFLLIILLLPTASLAKSGTNWIGLEDAPFVDVRSLGAVGDGVTNDSVAIQAAMDSGNPWIFFSPGTYLINDVVVPSTVTRISGSGSGVLGTGTTIKLAANTYGMSIANLVLVEHIQFLGELSESSIQSGTGLKISGNYSEVEHCLFWWCARGLDTTGSSQTKIRFSNFISCEKGWTSDNRSTNSTILDSHFYSCDSAIYMRDTALLPTEGITIQNVETMECGSYSKAFAALDFINIDYVFVSNCIIDFCYYYALYSDGGVKCNYSNSFFSSTFCPDPTVFCVFLKGNCQDSTMIGCTVAANKGLGMEIRGDAGSYSENVKLTNCVFDSNNASGTWGDLIVQDVNTGVSVNGCSFSSVGSYSIAIIASWTPTVLNINDSEITSNIAVNGFSAKYQGVGNRGITLENYGYATIPLGSSSVVVAHGLSYHSSKGVCAQATSVDIINLPITASPDVADVTYSIADVATAAINFYWQATLIP